MQGLHTQNLIKRINRRNRIERFKLDILNEYKELERDCTPDCLVIIGAVVALLLAVMPT